MKQQYFQATTGAITRIISTRVDASLPIALPMNGIIAVTVRQRSGYEKHSGLSGVVGLKKRAIDEKSAA